MKKLVSILFAITFIFSSIMSVTALAEGTANQDGLEASLSSPKIDYTASEDIEINLIVKNNNAYPVDGIKTTVKLPDGISVKSGNISQNTFSLLANESKTGIVTAINTNDNVGKIESDQTNNNYVIPKTSEKNNIWIWFGLMLISGGVIVTALKKGNKLKRNGATFLLVCIIMLGSVYTPMTINATSILKGFSVYKNLTINGETVTISAEISYGYVKRNTATVTDGGELGSYAEGDTVTITAAVPENGYHFTGWTW